MESKCWACSAITSAGAMAHQALIQRAPFQRDAITPLQQPGL